MSVTKRRICPAFANSATFEKVRPFQSKRAFRNACVSTKMNLVWRCGRGCGCIGHPAFPAPSVYRGANGFCKTSGAPRRGNAESRVYPFEFGIENLDATAVSSLSHKGRDPWIAGACRSAQESNNSLEI